EQSSIDNAINAINRIAETTRFSGTALLSGQSGFQTQSSVGTFLNDLNIRAMSFPQGVTSRTLSGVMATSAYRAFLRVGAVANSGVTIRISGPLGVQDVAIASSTTSAGVRAAINTVAPYTGVFASMIATAPAGGTVGHYAMSMEYGSSQAISIEVLRGGVGLSTGAVPGSLGTGQKREDTGQDPVINFNGIRYTGRGRVFRIVNSYAQFEFTLGIPTAGGSKPQNISIEPLATAGQLRFKVGNSGLAFQIREGTNASDQLRIGINGVGPSFLGAEEIPDHVSRAGAGSTTLMQGGYLSTMLSGGANDIVSGNKTNALKVVEASITGITGLRGHLGSVQAFNLEPNLRAVNVAVENLSASESSIRDLDFAEETANFTRTQILFQAGTAVLASANLIPQAVLTLLR
ncbi:MAG: flagellin, partial [Planctomycetota bacterium]|nr:flagellin [Planctomycetota bacterium]